jgi:glycosyltransferase involved in cell wall biosynthesis
MRILLVKSFPRLSSLKPLAREFINRGHDISILVPQENQDCMEMRALGIPTYAIDFVSKALITSNAIGRVGAHSGGVRTIINFLRPHSFDIINLNLYYARFYGRLASLFMNKSIVISTIRGFDSHYERWTNWIDTVTIAVSASVKKYLIHQGLPKNKIFVIPNGIYIDKSSTCSKDSKYLHNELGLTKDVKLIGIVAYFRGHQLKGHKVFLDAAEVVSKRFSDVRFVLVGSDIDGAGMKNDLENYAQRLYLQDKVYFLGERDDVKSIMDSLYINVLPSLSEGCPMVVLEAMARGVPNIASGLDSIKEIIKDKINGILTNPGDYRALAEAISSALDNPDEMREMGVAGRKTVQSCFNAKLMADRYEALFNKILSG